MLNLSQLDFIAVFVFLAAWLAYTYIAGFSPLRKHGIAYLMGEERKRWMLVMLDRELRVIDTSIINGLQQGSAFYASFCVLAIGGCFALLGATDDVLQVFNDLPINIQTSRTLWEFKILGLAAIYAYTFFKFSWSYRLFLYCSILMGGVTSFEQLKTEEIKRQARAQALKAGEINTIAAQHFDAGQRGVFFSVGYLGWLVSPQLLMVGGLLTLLVLLRRQFFSNSRSVITNDDIQ